jgi:hypothetical protein
MFKFDCILSEGDHISAGTVFGAVHLVVRETAPPAADAQAAETAEHVLSAADAGELATLITDRLRDEDYETTDVVAGVQIASLHGDDEESPGLLITLNPETGVTLSVGLDVEGLKGFVEALETLAADAAASAELPTVTAPTAAEPGELGADAMLRGGLVQLVATLFNVELTGAEVVTVAEYIRVGRVELAAEEAA